MEISNGVKRNLDELDLPAAGRFIVSPASGGGGEPMAHALTIGQVAKATGVATKTIRYYEEIGVLPRPRRTPAGYRQYDPPSVERLRFIRRARGADADPRAPRRRPATDRRAPGPS